MDKLLEKKLKIKFKWKDIDMEVIAIKAIGNYNQFVDESFSKSMFYNVKTDILKNYDVMYRELLNNGKCIFFKNYLVFKEGFEKEYGDYVLKYISNISEKDNLLLNSLKDKTSFSRIKSYIKMFKDGVLKKDTLFNIVSPNLINQEILNQII